MPGDACDRRHGKHQLPLPQVLLANNNVLLLLPLLLDDAMAAIRAVANFSNHCVRQKFPASCNMEEFGMMALYSRRLTATNRLRSSSTCQLAALVMYHHTRCRSRCGLLLRPPRCDTFPWQCRRRSCLVAAAGPGLWRRGGVRLGLVTAVPCVFAPPRPRRPCASR
jgi:hypothetical protein